MISALSFPLTMSNISCHQAGSWWCIVVETWKVTASLSLATSGLLVAILGLVLWSFYGGKPLFMRSVGSKQSGVRYNAAEGFNWRATEPLQFRPFKPKYHLTMAIETLDPHDLILFDKTYEERLEIRKNLVKDHPRKIIGITNEADPRIRAAIRELYHTLMGNYFPQRYPTIFQSEGSSIRNTVTGESWPTSLTDSTPARLALEILPVNVDEDFFILLPDNQADKKRTAGDEDETTYILEAYSACFPSGFEPQHKLGKRLASIHDPVPGYKERLEKSMDRFFRTLPPGKYVRRVNWAVTVDEELYSNFDKSGNAMTEKFKQLGVDDLDLDKTFLRCERQTLHRLPQSNAIVFAFHTYLYPLEQVKAEGLGEELATAIDGLTRGNTPDIFLYKNGPKWAEAVKQYLRG